MQKKERKKGVIGKSTTASAVFFFVSSSLDSDHIQQIVKIPKTDAVEKQTFCKKLINACLLKLHCVFGGHR